LSHSGATKAGVDALMRTWSAEWGPRNIRCNSVGPGLFPLADVHHENFFDKEKFRAAIPLRRFGVADEIVGPILFLLSESAKYITGINLAVDGGLRLRGAYF